MSLYVNKNLLLLIYYALFKNVASYGFEVWGGSYNNVYDFLNNIQNRFLKIINVDQTKILFIKQPLILNSINSHYDKLKPEFINSTTIV